MNVISLHAVFDRFQVGLGLVLDKTNPLLGLLVHVYTCMPQWGRR